MLIDKILQILLVITFVNHTICDATRDKSNKKRTFMWHIYEDKNDNDTVDNIPMTKRTT